MFQFLNFYKFTFYLKNKALLSVQKKISNWHSVKKFVLDNATYRPIATILNIICVALCLKPLQKSKQNYPFN